MGEEEGKAERAHWAQEATGTSCARVASPHRLRVTPRAVKSCYYIVQGGWSQAGKHPLGWARGTGRLAPGAPRLHQLVALPRAPVAAAPQCGP